MKVFQAFYNIATIVLWLSMMVIGACKVYCWAYGSAREAVAVYQHNSGK